MKREIAKDGKTVSLVLEPNKGIELPKLSISEAFGDELDLSESILNIDYKKAIKEPTYFIISWIRFNYKLTENELKKLPETNEGLIHFILIKEGVIKEEEEYHTI